MALMTGQLGKLLKLAAICGLVFVAPRPALADKPQLQVIPNGDLRFGRFAVMGTTGYRTVSASGAVSDGGIFSTGTGDTGPARFTVLYDRGNNGRRVLNLQIQLVFYPPPTIVVGGVTARLSDYQSDLPNAPQVAPGQIIEINIPNCRSRVCQTSFSLGGRLDVERNFGGGRVNVPIPVDATLVSVN